MSQMLKTKVPVTEVHVRLRRTSNTTMPRHRHRQVGHRKKQKLELWRNSTKLSKKYLVFLYNGTASGTATLNFWNHWPNLDCSKTEKQRRLLWTQAFVKSCNKSFWSLDLKRKIRGKHITAFHLYYWKFTIM